MPDILDYGKLVNKAMRSLVRMALLEVAEHGLPGQHHFLISFVTTHPRVNMADWLHEVHPSEMTIVMQNWYENLNVDEIGFSVTLNFNDTPEPIYIPFDAILKFADPSVEFGLSLQDTEPNARPQDEIDDAPDEETRDENVPPRKGAAVVDLDQFRK